MSEHLPPFFESSDSFGQSCPRCTGPLRDRTAVESDEGLLFFRVRFKCPSCGYWLCTRCENFSVLGPEPEEGEPAPDYLSAADQRIRHDLTQMIVRQFMPAGVDSYEAGRVWLSGEGVVSKTWSQFSTGGLHICLTHLAGEYFRRSEAALELRAMELAVDALRAGDKRDPSLSAADPDNAHNAAQVLARLAELYEHQGRQAEAQALFAEARAWAPEVLEGQTVWGRLRGLVLRLRRRS